MASKNQPASPRVSSASLFEFPCKFPVKAMGLNVGGFEVMVREIVLTHAEIFADTAIATSTSHSGKYLSVTINIEACSKSQLDRIYRDLSACEKILVAL